MFLGVLCEEEVKDVVEGQDVLLECRFSVEEEEAGQSGPAPTLYWIRTSQGQHDNVAIGSNIFSPGYKWVYRLYTYQKISVVMDPEWLNPDPDSPFQVVLDPGPDPTL